MSDINNQTCGDCRWWNGESCDSELSIFWGKYKGFSEPACESIDIEIPDKINRSQKQ